MTEDNRERVAEIEAKREACGLGKQTLSNAIGRCRSYWSSVTTNGRSAPTHLLDAAEEAIEFTEKHGYPPEPSEMNHV